MIAYERFEAWRLAHRLALDVFSATDSWPRSELFVLTSQARRAALSVPTNLAEGAAKRGRREFARFLDISLGSLAELSYLLRFSRDRNLLSEPQWEALESTRDQTGRLVFGLYRRMRKPTSETTDRANQQTSSAATLTPAP
jgi:four helix bundle protein